MRLPCLKQLGFSCVFVSIEAAAELRELAQRARDSISWTEFKSDYRDQTRAQHLKALCEKWSGCSQEEAYEALQRVKVETISEDLLVKIYCIRV